MSIIHNLVPFEEAWLKALAIVRSNEVIRPVIGFIFALLNIRTISLTWFKWDHGPLTKYAKLRLRMRCECRERFPRHRLQRKPLGSDPGMHHGTCVTHVPWCMSGLLTRGSRENVPGILGACATRKFTYLVRGPSSWFVMTTIVLCWLWCDYPCVEYKSPYVGDNHWCMVFNYSSTY